MNKMPVLFVGHGSPLNAIEENAYTREWRKLAESIPKPKAILSVSAHWYARGSKVNSLDEPKQIYDMYGFPQELYDLVYPAKGSPVLAKRVQELLPGKVETDNSWGIDHGTWSVLVKMYPHADIPVVQLSVDRTASAEAHLTLGKALKPLRDEGILILASGNVVHNLSRVAWNMHGGFDWALDFDKYIKDRVLNSDHDGVAGYALLGQTASLAVPTPDHFFPLLYALGASETGDEISVFNEACVLGSLSMTGYVFS